MDRLKKKSGILSELKKEHGSTIVETMICMLVLCLILFGLLQLTILFSARMITDYSAFRAARSAMVGFNEFIYTKEAKIKAIPASGWIVNPYYVAETKGIVSRMQQEKMVILDYLTNSYVDLQYEYWQRSKLFNSETSFHVVTEKNTETVSTTVCFQNYPFRFPFARAFISSGTMDVVGRAELSNHSSVYLQE